eukprot:TRINITY_DN311_c1_g1_i10.p1 TRINITY_DN311_c1_g1~~TRINITY_DN311_c1_g1_i10.p1  ORF type:complete len:155 (-),score=17.92 TRINITY_DN311_c1_g1_i10:794-1258(-)
MIQIRVHQHHLPLFLFLLLLLLLLLFPPFGNDRIRSHPHTLSVLKSQYLHQSEAKHSLSLNRVKKCMIDNNNENYFATTTAAAAGDYNEEIVETEARKILEAISPLSYQSGNSQNNRPMSLLIASSIPDDSFINEVYNEVCVCLLLNISCYHRN